MNKPTELEVATKALELHEMLRTLFITTPDLDSADDIRNYNLYFRFFGDLHRELTAQLFNLERLKKGGSLQEIYDTWLQKRVRG